MFRPAVSKNMSDRSCSFLGKREKYVVLIRYSVVTVFAYIKTEENSNFSLLLNSASPKNVIAADICISTNL